MPAQPKHPGRVLFEKFMEPSGMSCRSVAKSMGLTTTRISDLIAGRRGMTADTAIRLEARFRKPRRYWLTLQMEWDLAVAEKALAKA